MAPNRLTRRSISCSRPLATEAVYRFSRKPYNATMNEEKLKKGARKLWAVIAGTAVAATAGTAACVFAAKCGIIDRTSLLPASFAWTTAVFAAAIAWTSRMPGEVWRKVIDQLNGHIVLILAIGFCLMALTDASLLQRAFKTGAKLDEISARLDEISTNALIRTDLVSPVGDPPGMTLAEAALVLSNAYNRIYGTNDVDREIGSTPKPKDFGAIKNIDKTEKDEKQSPPYYGPF